jgi:CMP/dCMP kinase
MGKKITITIDGPAGAGKSTTARMVAEHLGYIYVDTGAMYRAVTLAALESRTPLTESGMDDLLPHVQVTLRNDARGQRTYLNGRDVSDDIRRADVTNLVSQVSAMPIVRRAMVELQRNLGANGGIVMDGRDIGSVVFPGAEVKVFLVADVDERVRRRLAESREKDATIDEEAIRKQIVERDRLDSERDVSPLIRPEGAVEIDTTSLTIDEQVEKIVDLARQYLKAYSLISSFGNL